VADVGDEGTLSSAIGDDIRLPKLSHLVAGRLRDQIASGKLKPGSMLLPESKLLEIFKVSRPTLREALRILEAESLIGIGRGMRSGALVLGPSMQKAAEYANFMLVSEGVTMRDLHEARMFLEPAIVRSLKGRALADATSQLRSCIDDIQKALSSQRYLEVVSGTNRFHEALARASGNRAVALLVGMLQTISDDAYAVILATDSATTPADVLQKNMTKTVAGYAALCDLLEKGKTSEAAAFWQRYMERSLEFLKRSKIGERKLVQNSAGAQGGGNDRANR
jgi:DNA-binding FadR family transcriptional regulator